MTPLHPIADKREARELVERLRAKAVISAKIQRQMAEAKSRRNSDGKHDDLYSWLTPERTIEGEAAALIERLLDATAEQQRIVPGEDSPALRLEIAAAIKTTQYKYFGSYELSDDQQHAVDVLVAVAEKHLAALISSPVAPDGEGADLCDDCPPVGYPTDKTRCTPCPRRNGGKP